MGVLLLIIPIVFSIFIFIIKVLFKLAAGGAKIAGKILFFGLPFITAFFAAQQIMKTVPILTEQADGHTGLMTFAVFCGVSFWFYFMMTRQHVSHAVSMLLTATTLYMLFSIIFMLFPLETMTWKIMGTILYAGACYILLHTNQKIVALHWDSRDSARDASMQSLHSNAEAYMDLNRLSSMEADIMGYSEGGDKAYLAGINAALCAISAYLLVHVLCTFVWRTVVPKALYLNIAQWAFVALVAVNVFFGQLHGKISS